MSTEIEREFTFLVNKLPEDLDKFPSKIIGDNYIPREVDHPVIRIRRNGDKLMITKKYPVDSVNDGQSGDSSRQIEHTIDLTQSEFNSLSQLDGKKLKKHRFFYKVDSYEAEIDVYLDRLFGLVLIDFEFDSDEEMQNFKKPNFVAGDVTQEILIAGGILAGKAYSDIAGELRKKYNYEPVLGVEKYAE